MLATGLIIAALALDSGLGLSPGDPPPAEPTTTTTAPAPAPPPGDDGLPVGALLAGLAAAAAALAAARPGAALGLRPPEDALVVFVPGHGQGAGAGVFGEFVAEMGLDPDQARYFDYRWVTGQASARRASEGARIGAAAAALDAYVAGVAGAGHPVWLVGFSKGGATVAELVARWDRTVLDPPPGVRGAMLLDPPMASGLHGLLQSVGTMVGPIPDDGGYDPVDCAFLWFACRDARAHLGEPSGVEVLVVRNPQAGITSFDDRPPGLRVIDAPDGGPGGWEQLLRNPFALFSRLSAAHESVLADPRVARCLVEEMWQPGSCRLDRPPVEPRFPPRRILASSHAGRAM